MIKFQKLSEVAELTVGFVGTMGKHYSEDGVTFLRSLNIKPFSFDLSDIKYIPLDFNEKLKKSELHTDDVVIVRTGIPGTCAVVPPELDGCNCADLVIVRPNKKLINPYFLCAFINSWGRAQISNTKVGAVQKHFNISSAKDMLIPMVDMVEQKKIADLIYSINLKIENNDSICMELESLAKEIYNYWFVQFDFPDANGKPYKSSGGNMVWNEELKRDIPKGWDIKGFSSIAKLVWGQCPDGKDILPLTAENENLLDYCSGAGDMRSGLIVDCQAKTTIEASRRTAKKHSVLVSVAGSIGALCLTDHDISLGRAALAIEPFDKKNVLFTYLTLQTHLKQINNLATGSIQKVINSNHIDSMAFPYSEEVMNRFGDIVIDIDQQLSNVYSESRELIKLRDYILPMLMNGQINLSNK